MIYLIKSASYNHSKIYYKIGFTKNLNNRLKSYISDNPTVEVVEYIDTYAKTRHALEKALHNELKALGYQFHTSLFNTITEWIEVDAVKPIRLEQFKACKGRKIIKWSKA